MPAPSSPRRSSFLSLVAALGDRTTRREGVPPSADGLAAHLRVLIARVLRTGRGPAGLVGWVRRQSAEATPCGEDPAEHLAGQLLGRLIPSPEANTVTVVG